MSKQSKTAFNLARITELLDKVIEREGISKEGESYADLGFVKYYAKELTRGCDDCQETQKDPPVGQNETE